MNPSHSGAAISTHFNRAAAKYDHVAELQQASAAALLNWVLPTLTGKNAPIILDAGAGTGALTKPLASAGARVWAVDLAPNMLSQLASFDNVQTICTNMAELPMPDNMLDMVVSNFSLHWVGPSVLNELLRVLRVGGELYVAVPVVGSLQKITERYTGFTTFNFIHEREWISAANPTDVSIKTFQQTLPNMRALLYLLRSMGGNQLGSMGFDAHSSPQPYAAKKALLQSWLDLDRLDPSPVALEYRVCFFKMTKTATATATQSHTP